MNKETRIQGRMDTELSEVGVRQAEAIRDVLSDAGVVFTYIYCSPLKRAMKTCEIVSGVSADGFIIDDRLIEMDFGALEGHPYKELTLDKRALFTAPENYEPDGGESIQDLVDRTGDFLESIKCLPADASVLVSSHGAAIHAMLSYIKNKEQKDFWDEEVHNCDTIVAELVSGEYVCTGEVYAIPGTIQFDYVWTYDNAE